MHRISYENAAYVLIRHPKRYDTMLVVPDPIPEDRVEHVINSIHSGIWVARLDHGKFYEIDEHGISSDPIEYQFIRAMSPYDEEYFEMEEFSKLIHGVHQ